MSRRCFMAMALLWSAISYAKGHEFKHEASGASAEIIFLKFHKENNAGVNALLGDFEVRNLSEKLIVIPIMRMQSGNLVKFPDAVLQYSNSDKKWQDAFYNPGIFFDSKEVIRILPGSSAKITTNLQPLVDAERLLWKLRLVLQFRSPKKCVESIPFKIDG